MKNAANFVLDSTRRTLKGALYSIALGASGVGLGLILGLTDRRRTSKPEELTDEQKKLFERDRLVRKVKVYGVVRGYIEMIEPMVNSVEYDARRRLEAMGYYPCQKCGIPHVHPEDKSNCLPEGAYWSSSLQRYVHPGHPDWSIEEYETVTGQKWQEADDEEPPVQH